MSSQDDETAQQRQFYRATVDFPVRVSLGADAHDDATVHDLSGGGLRLSTPASYERGQSVELRFFLPQHTRELVVRGRVVLSYFAGSEQRYHHGIAFTSIGAQDREAIVHYIHDVQRRELKGHINTP